MIDSKLLKNNLKLVAKKLARKNFKLDINSFSQRERDRKLLQTKVESLQAKRNYQSKEIGIAKSYGKDIKILLQKVKETNNILDVLKKKLKFLQDYIKKELILLPNIPLDEIPDGKDENSNIEILKWGNPKQYNFPIRNHIELGKITEGLDFTISTEITGTRFVVMRGQIAQLHRALIQFMLDTHIQKHNYIEYYLPYLVNNFSMYCAGQLPKFSKDLFFINSNEKIKNNSYALIPTAEVPLVNLVRNKIIDEDSLPIKIVSHTPCFRSEAGSYGKESQGLIRMHQFEKVEIVQIVHPLYSIQALEEITGHAEKILQLLELPYRKVLLCAGNIGFASCKTYDLEVWLPSRNSYCEVSSCSNTGDFQSRRMKSRFYSKEESKLKLVHILNGSGLAVSRTLVAILENYQLDKGFIKIPNVLIPYMKGLTFIG